MKYALINGSPKLIMKKADPCASHIILQDFKKLLRREHVHNIEDFHIKTPALTEEEMTDLFSCDAWIFSFPIYARGIPSHLLYFMTTLESKMPKLTQPIRVYAIANGARYEGSEAYPLLRMMQQWCVSCGLNWCGGIGVGGGPLHTEPDLFKFRFRLHRSYARCLETLAIACGRSAAALNSSCTPDISKKRYVLYINRTLKKKAKSYGLSTLDLDKQI